MVGTGEYTTGYVRGASAAADKKAGVVGVTLFDLRRRGLVDRLLMAGTDGTKFREIREHLDSALAQVYRGMDVSFEGFPADHVTSDRAAYRQALTTLEPGDCAIIFTPGRHALFDRYGRDRARIARADRQADCQNGART